MSERCIKPGSRVKLNFSLCLESGDEIDSNFDQLPVELLLGNGDMFPSFEQTLVGLCAGEQVEAQIPCEEAFGVSSEDNRQRFARRNFEPAMELQPGLVVSFSEPSGGELPGVIIELDDDYVLVDFNHPLADKTIVFKAMIHEVLS